LVYGTLLALKEKWCVIHHTLNPQRKEACSMGFNPTVDEDKCQGCEECVDVCPVEVFEMVDGKSSPVNAEECLGCESCVEVCEPGAITVEET
jgi:NAD-dependent dihydropyrimidine dehydrogenase PreA subunit